MSTQPLQFGRYELLERIAAGGMGEVYVGVQTGIGDFRRPVAVKRLLPHLASVLCCAACHTFWCNVDGSGSLAVKFCRNRCLAGQAHNPANRALYPLRLPAGMPRWPPQLPLR